MEVDAALWRASCAGGECDQRGIIGGCLDYGVRAWRCCQAAFQVIGGDDVLQNRRIGARCFEFRGAMRVDNGVRDLRLVEDLGEFVGAQHRHGANGNAARAEDTHQTGRDSRVFEA